MQLKKIQQSRNQREGKFLCGWVVNPPYNRRAFKRTGKLVQSKRAGAWFDARVIYHKVTGRTILRTLRQGAYQ